MTASPGRSVGSRGLVHLVLLAVIEEPGSTSADVLLDLCERGAVAEIHGVANALLRLTMDGALSRQLVRRPGRPDIYSYRATPSAAYAAALGQGLRTVLTTDPE